MIKRFLTFAIVLTLIAGCKNDKDRAKDTKKDKEQNKTEYVEQEYFFPPEIVYYTPNLNYLVDKFYPIGWSSDGNFAYICEPADEAVDNYLFEIYVINVLNSDTLWSWHSDYNQETVREEVWKDNYEYFKTQLNKFHIIQLKEPQLLGPYFTYGGNDFVVELKEETPERPGLGFNAVRWSTITLKSPQLGKKIISDFDFGPNSIIIGQSISGVMLSPDGQYIAVIVQMERPGYEGPPNVITFRIAGANLLTGFTQDQ